MYRLLLVTVISLLWSAASATAQSCVCVACLLDSTLENFQAVSESMAPALSPGDCSVMRHVDPASTEFQRGDVIGFRTGVSETMFIFRIVALEGDLIAIRDGQVILNGTPLEQQFIAQDETVYPPRPPFPICIQPVAAGEACLRDRLRESIGANKVYDIYDTGPRGLDDTGERLVPPGHVFVLGDHRDNANDSRVPVSSGGPGMVPLEQVLGVFEDL